MAKKRKRARTGKCVHCGECSTELTDDHVFPEAWYPNSTPLDLAKWKIPACRTCNEKHGKNESELLIRLGKHFSLDDPEFGSLAAKAMRATNPAFAKNPEDAQHRSRKRARLLKELTKFNPGHESNALPGFGPTRQGAGESYFGLLISEDSINMLSEKIVKGLAYLFDGSFIGKSHKFEVKQVPAPIPELMETITKYGSEENVGPAILSAWAFVAGDPACRMHYIRIWRRWHMYVFCTPRLRASDHQDAV